MSRARNDWYRIYTVGEFRSPSPPPRTCNTLSLFRTGNRCIIRDFIPGITRVSASVGFKLKHGATLWSTIAREGNKSDLVCRRIVVDRRRTGESRYNSPLSRARRFPPFIPFRCLRKKRTSLDRIKRNWYGLTQEPFSSVAAKNMNMNDEHSRSAVNYLLSLSRKIPSYKNAHYR